MYQTLTDDEIRVLYQEKQREPFPRRKNLMGILVATVFFIALFALYLFVIWLIMKLTATI